MGDHRTKKGAARELIAESEKVRLTLVANSNMNKNEPNARKWINDQQS